MPYAVCVTLNCRVTNLCSEIQFIQDFAGTTLLTEEYGFLMTVLKVSFLTSIYRVS